MTGGPRAARDVAVGTSWAFREHRTMAEVLRDDRIRRLAGRGLDAVDIAIRLQVHYQIVARLLLPPSPARVPDGGATPPRVPSPAEVRPAGAASADIVTASGATSPAAEPSAPPPLSHPVAAEPSSPPPLLSRPSREDEIAAFIAQNGVTRCPTKFLAPSDHAKAEERDVPALLARVPTPAPQTREEVKAAHSRLAGKARRWTALRARERRDAR